LRIRRIPWPSDPALAAHVIDKALTEDAPKARAEYQNIWRED
jgi:hypothetical protein